MREKLFITCLLVVMATVCQSQLPYPIQPRFVVPIRYVEAPDNSEFYPRRQYLAMYGQTPEEDLPDEYTYEDYYSEDPFDPLYPHQDSPSDLLMKYVLSNQRAREDQIELRRRNQIEKSQTLAPEPHTKGQKEFAMYRNPVDGRRTRPAWYPSLEDQLSRVKGRKQQKEVSTQKQESKGKKDELTVQLDKLKNPKV